MKHLGGGLAPTCRLLGADIEIFAKHPPGPPCQVLLESVQPMAPIVPSQLSVMHFICRR